MARAAAAGAELIELRVDLIGDIPAVERLLAGPRPVPYILTLRSASEGGAWDGPDDERVAIIERLGLLMPGYIDVELETFERSANVRQKLGLVADLGAATDSAAQRRPRNKLILSIHDFRVTPDNLAALLDRFPHSPNIICKAAFATRDAHDSLRILVELQRRTARRQTVLIGMGESGIATRVLARKFGAMLSYAALDPETASAPGQLSPAAMREHYRWDSIRAGSKVYGVVGWPVAHSKSPMVHNTGMARVGICGVYLPWPVAPGYDSFARFMDTLTQARQLDISGLSVTIPHKQNAYCWLLSRGADLSEIARRSGAVNTLSWNNNRWHGDNTDVDALREQFAGINRKLRVMIIGAGGVARAAAAAAVAPERQVVIVNRTPDRAAALAAEFACESADWAARGDVNADLIIQCTSVGMQPDAERSPLPADSLRPGATIIETVYAPPTTRLMRDALERGCRVISGVDMFISQAAAQFRLWHGAPPPAGLFEQLLSPQR